MNFLKKIINTKKDSKKFTHIRLWTLTIVIITLSSISTACQKLDVIGNGSVTSFQKMLEKLPQEVVENKEYGTWALSAPDNSVTFYWSIENTSNIDYDVMMKFDVQPFVDAGLDISKLPKDMLKDNNIIVGAKFENVENGLQEFSSPVTSYQRIMEEQRDRIGYHAALDHYGIELDNGNMVEWAKDLEENDKDIVFVLNPETFIEAGVDPEKVEGWVYAEVMTMDQNGKDIEIHKFLKPFDLP